VTYKDSESDHKACIAPGTYLFGIVSSPGEGPVPFAYSDTLTSEYRHTSQLIRGLKALHMTVSIEDKSQYPI
jgi:hypothetical protein